MLSDWSINGNDVCVPHCRVVVACVFLIFRVIRFFAVHQMQCYGCIDVFTFWCLFYPTTDTLSQIKKKSSKRKKQKKNIHDQKDIECKRKKQNTTQGNIHALTINLILISNACGLKLQIEINSNICAHCSVLAKWCLPVFIDNCDRSILYSQSKPIDRSIFIWQLLIHFCIERMLRRSL